MVSVRLYNMLFLFLAGGVAYMIYQYHSISMKPFLILSQWLHEFLGEKRPSQPRFATSQPHSQAAFETQWYCWWKKSCTTWDVQNPVNNGINYLSTGAGILPSTVAMECSVVPSSLGLASFCSSFDDFSFDTITATTTTHFIHRHRWRLLFCCLQPRAQHAMKWKWNNVITCDQIPTSTMRDPWGRMSKLRSTRPCCQHVKNSGKKYFHSTSFGSHLSGRSLKAVAWHRCSCLAEQA